MPDIRYQDNLGQVPFTEGQSPTEIDNQYLEAVKRGDMDTAQKIVDEMLS